MAKGLRAALTAALCLTLNVCALAQSVLPAPRVVGEMHIGAVRQIRSTPDGRLVLTIGADKTLRIWRTADLAPVRTIYLPSDAGDEGDPRSLAISPDGRQIYVGGWTGVDWHGGLSQVYVLDIDTGAMRQVWRGQPGVIVSMALSQDGRQLALGLSQSLRVLDTRDGHVIFEDKEHGGSVGFADYAPDGSLATVADDGCVRIYSPERTLRFRAAYPAPARGTAACPGGKFGGIRFAPDGKSLAFGLIERPEVVLVSVADLRVLRTLVVKEPGQKGLCCISWSKGGDVLTVYGEHERSEQTPLYRVDQGGMGVARRFDVGRNALTNTSALADGGMIVATDTPQLLRIDAQGRTLAAAEPANADFRQLGNRLRLSADGARVTFTLGASETPLVFTLKASSTDALRALTADPSAELRGPMRAGPLTVSAELGRFSYLKPMRVGSVDLPMSAGESLYSWAGHASRSLVALGTGWAVKLVDATGKALWSSAITSPAYGVNLSEDGLWVVAALGDGTLRWLDSSTGREALGLFVHRSTQEWVAWRSDGFYTSSPRGDQLFGWLVNRGDSNTPDFLRAVQFERELYRPDLVRAALSGRLAAAAAGEQLSGILRKLAAPRVTIESILPGAEPDTLAIRFSAESTGRSIREVGVYVDDIPVLTAAERFVPEGGSGRLTRTVLARTASASAAVRVEAESDGALGLDESAAATPPRPATTPRSGRLWVVAAGVAKFDGLTGQRSLPNATNDARELARALVAQTGKAFSDVHVAVLTEESGTKPTKANLLAQLRALDQMRPEDTLVVFIASHGDTDAAEYFVIPKDATQADLSKLIAAQDKRAFVVPGSVPSLLTGTELTLALRRLPGRRILILDTCYSASGGKNDPYSLVKRSASAQLAVVSAASGDESSYESPTRPHGVFTIAVIDALTGRLGLPGGPITLRAAFDAAVPQVNEAMNQLRQGTRDVAQRASIRQTPVLSAPKALERSVVAYQ